MRTKKSAPLNQPGGATASAAAAPPTRRDLMALARKRFAAKMLHACHTPQHSSGCRKTSLIFHHCVIRCVVFAPRCLADGGRDAIESK